MTWHAKPSGSYGINSTEGLDNINEMSSNFSGFTYESRAAIIGNSVHEGGLNPWRWQYDSEAQIPNGGYGLFQFTPGEDYLMLPDSTPNFSTTHQTPEATSEDGAVQCQCVASDRLHKWVGVCWRPYWNDDGTMSGTPLYPDLYNYRSQILSMYGGSGGITLSQFKLITDVDAATFVFLACYEGPRIPNYTARQSTAWDIYNILMGYDPPIPPTPPVPPTPYPPDPGNVPLWILKKIRDNNFNNML